MARGTRMSLRLATQTEYLKRGRDLQSKVVVFLPLCGNSGK